MSGSEIEVNGGGGWRVRGESVGRVKAFCEPISLTAIT